MRSLLVFAVFLLVGLSACNKISVGEKAPQITYISTSPREFKSGESGRVVVVTFEIFDEDGDVGDPNGDSTNVFVGKTDYTAASDTKLPGIPEEFHDPENGLKGIATVKFPTAPFVLDSLHQDGDSFKLTLYITDNKGHASNPIETEYIYIKP